MWPELREQRWGSECVTKLKGRRGFESHVTDLGNDPKSNRQPTKCFPGDEGGSLCEVIEMD